MSATWGRNATAVGLIGLGLLFFVGQFVNFSIIGTLWPFFVILPGAVFLYYAVTGDARHAGLAVPGAMITGTGGILLYQNITNHWSSWAYVWAFYPVFLGFALVFIGRRTGNENTIRVGDGFVKWGLFGFIALWVLFELLIFGGNSQLISTLVPLALIGAGIFLLRRPRAKLKSSPAKTKYSNGYHSTEGETLQDKIDRALAEDDEVIV